MCKDHGTDTTSPFICRHDVIKASIGAAIIAWAAPQYWPLSFGRTLVYLFGIIVVLLVIMVYRSLTIKTSQLTSADMKRIAAKVDKATEERMMADKLVLAERLAAAVRIPTIRYSLLSSRPLYPLSTC
jgi:hypothetical protein